MQIYIKDLNEDDYNTLKAINDTRTASEIIDFKEYKQLLNGHGRIIFYDSNGNQ